jgi:hypothetical protein
MMSDRGFTNDPYGYLPPSLQNDFIKDGHNRYDEDKAAVKAAKEKLVTDRKAGRSEKKAAAKVAYEKEHPVSIARKAIRTERAAKGPSTISQADAKSRIAAAKADPNSASSERKAAKDAREEKRATKLRSRADKLSAKD